MATERTASLLVEWGLSLDLETRVKDEGSKHLLHELIQTEEHRRRAENTHRQEPVRRRLTSAIIAIRTRCRRSRKTCLLLSEAWSGVTVFPQVISRNESLSERIL